MKTRLVLLSLVSVLLLGFQKPIFSQCVGSAKFGSDSVTCVTNLSLYREFYKQKNYKDAYTPWRWIIENCPCAKLSPYVDGIKIMDNRIQSIKDPRVRELAIDSLLAIYDLRIKNFPVSPTTKKNQVGEILTRKGMDYFNYRPNDAGKAYEILQQAIKVDSTHVMVEGIVTIMQVGIKMVKDGKAEKTLVIDTYDQLSDLIENNINFYAQDSAAQSVYIQARGNLEFLFEPFATCEDLVSIYTPKFEQNPNDASLLKKITKILDKKKCTDSQLFYAATEKLHKLEPSATSAYLMARKYLKEEKYEVAAQYLKEAINLFGPEDIDKKAKAYLLLGNVYLGEKNYTQAKQYALKVLDLKPSDGNAYILIGDAYAAGANACGDNDLTKRAPFWAAVDKYQTAKRIDPSVTPTADKRISTYAASFPSMETIFFYGLKQGEGYRVECWINESTTIRTSR
jgi:tetratricopeptide (TPR) repeat protein